MTRQIGDTKGSLRCVDVIDDLAAVWEGCGLQYLEDLSTGAMALTDRLSLWIILNKIRAHRTTKVARR